MESTNKRGGELEAESTVQYWAPFIAETVYLAAPNALQDRGVGAPAFFIPRFSVNDCVSANVLSLHCDWACDTLSPAREVPDKSRDNEHQTIKPT